MLYWPGYSKPRWEVLKSVQSLSHYSAIYAINNSGQVLLCVQGFLYACTQVVVFNAVFIALIDTVWIAVA